MMGTKIGSGSLRAVEAKTEKHPGYKGSITIGDRKYWLSGWKRKGDDGKPWLSLSVENVEEDEKPAPKTYVRRHDGDDFGPLN